MIYLQTGHTALQRAAAGGHLEIAKLLITQGASLDHQDELVRLTYNSFFSMGTQLYMRPPGKAFPSHSPSSVR